MACECVPRPLDTRFEKADAIFIGVAEEVVEITDYEPLPEIADWAENEPAIKVLFKVRRNLKNADAKEFTLHTSYSRSSCSGYMIDEAKEYLVFAYKRRETGGQGSSYAFPAGTYGVGGLCGDTASTDWEVTKEEIKTLENKIRD